MAEQLTENRKAEVMKELRKIVGAGAVSDSEVVRESYKYLPFSGITWRINYDFVVIPHTTQEVSEIVKLANRYEIPIAPRGGCGWGGFKGGILIDLTLMNRILKIDVENAKAITEGGCSVFKLSYELFKVGLMILTTEYGPAPTVGASVQNPTVAFGKTRYGQNSEMADGLEIVLPSGEIVRVGSLAYEDTEYGPYSRLITGPDLVGLFIKHGGALGIITRVSYRCLRKPEKFGFYSYYWPRSETTALTQATRELVMREVFDVHINDRWKTQPLEDSGSMPRLPDDAWFLLFLIVTAESDDELAAKEKWTRQICDQHGGKEMKYNIWKMHWDWPTFFNPSAHPLTREIVKRSDYGFFYVPDSFYYPLSKFPEVYDIQEGLARKYDFWREDRQFVLDAFVTKDLVMCSQVWTFIDPYDPEMRKAMGRYHFESENIFGEKGGTWQNMFPPFVPDWAWKNQQEAHEIIKKIKRLLDPNNIMMPGNIY